MTRTDNGTVVPSLPSYWYFVWMFFMQPITLHHQLKACGVSRPEISGEEYWQQRHNLPPIYNFYLRRLLVLHSIPLICFGWFLVSVNRNASMFIAVVMALILLVSVTRSIMQGVVLDLAVLVGIIGFLCIANVLESSWLMLEPDEVVPSAVHMNFNLWRGILGGGR